MNNGIKITEIIAVTVSAITLALMWERHNHDIRMSKEQGDLRDLQIELHKEQIIELKNKNSDGIV